MTEQTDFHNFVVAEETLKNIKMYLELMEEKESQATELVQPVTNDSLIVLSLLFFLMEVISSHCPQLFRNIEISLAWLSQSGVRVAAENTQVQILQHTAYQLRFPPNHSLSLCSFFLQCMCKWHW